MTIAIRVAWVRGMREMRSKRVHWVAKTGAAACRRTPAQRLCVQAAEARCQIQTTAALLQLTVES